MRLQFSIPLMAGIALAVGAGGLCGAAYLDLATVDLALIPWLELGVLGAGSAAVAIGAAYLVSIGSGTRLTASLVRRE